MLRNSLLMLIAALASASASSCGTDTAVKYDMDGYVAPQEDAGDLGSHTKPKPKPGEEDSDPLPDGSLPEGDRYEIVLLHDTTEPYKLIKGEHEPIRAKVLDFFEQTVAVEYPVKYTVLGSNPECDEGEECGHFLVMEGMTDAQGVVSVTFEASESCPTLYTVELSGEDAAPVTMDVEVQCPPTGTLRVHLKYDGPVALKNVNVRVMHGLVSCTQFKPVNPWKDDLDGQKTVSGIDSVPEFPGLAVSSTYTIFATAEKKDTGHLAASGCTDAVHLIPIEQGKTEVTLNLYVLTLNPAGTYDTVNHFDFTDAIPGEAGKIINFVVDLFTDPGKIIIDLVKELVSQYIGEWVTDLAFSLFEDALSDIVTDWLLNNSPSFIQDFFVIGQDLIQIVNNVELTSILKLSKLTNDYYFQGEQNWTGINLYWKLGCDKNDPNYDECGKNEFSLQDLVDTDFPLDLISGHFTGMIANYDNLIIDTHKIDLNYGKLILFVINEILLPAISGYNSLEDLLYSIVDCEAIADGFVGDILGAIGMDKDQVKGFCLSAVGFIVSPVEELISGLSLDSKLRVHGKCRMLDETDDLLVDKLLDGLWWGHVEIGGDEGAEFEGDFEAVRAEYPGP
jgi:hypothetical protein